MPADWETLSFRRPELLWLLVGAVGFLLIRARLSSGAEGARRWRSFVSMWLRMGAYAALCVAAAGPFRLDREPDLAVGLVVDATGSGGGGRLVSQIQKVRAFWEGWPRADGPRPVLLGVGGSAAGGAGPRPGVRVFRHPDELAETLSATSPQVGTDLEPALLEAMERLPPAKSRAIVVFTDGATTRGTLDRVVGLAQARDIHLHAVPPDTGRLSVALRGLDLAQDIRTGAPVAARVSVASNAAAPAAVVVRGPRGTVLARQEVQLQAGPQDVALEFPATGDGGILRVRASVEAPGDVFSADNERPGLVRVLGSARALFVGDPTMAAPLREAVAGMRPPLQVSSAPATTRPPWTGHDLVALLDPDLPAMGAAGAAAMRAWVVAGGHLLVTGGPHGLVVDKPGLEPIQDLLPLRFPETEKEEPAPVAVVYCIDRSDSMARFGKFELALSAVAASVGVLADEAETGVLTFSDFPKWVRPLGALGDRGALLDQLAGLTVHGGTSIYPALQAAYDALRSSRALVKHVVLLTDGRSTTVYERHGAVVDAFASASITLSTVAISREADTSQLERIAGIGRGRYYYTEDIRSLPQVLIDETMKVIRTNKVEERFRVLAVPASRFLEGVPIQGIPDLMGYVRARQKAGSELALATDRGEPVLLGWRFGRGSVTVFTSDVGGPWSASWKAWGAARSLWRRVVSETLEPPPPPDVHLETESHGRDVVARYVVQDALGAPRDDLTVAGEAVDGEGVTRPLTLDLVAPGTYQARLRLPEGEAWLIQAGAVAPGAGPVPLGAPRLVRSVAPDPPEETWGGTLNAGLLEQLTRATGGRLAPTVAQVMREGVDTREVEVDLWRPWLVGALAALLAELVVRRARVPRRGR